MISDRPCERCGAIIKDAWHGQKYCAVCKDVAFLEYQKQYNAKRLAVLFDEKPIRYCKICGTALPKDCGNRELCSDECRKISAERVRKEYAKRCRCAEKSQKADVKLTAPKASKNAKLKPLKGKYIGDAFYPTVTVKQPKVGYTQNQIMSMATAQHISYKECAERLGV